MSYIKQTIPEELFDDYRGESQIQMFSPLESQIAGDHYRKMKIQPVEFIHANNIPYIEGSCIKYLCRWRDKGGIEDLKKVKHFIDLLIELESKE